MNIYIYIYIIYNVISFLYSIWSHIICICDIRNVSLQYIAITSCHVDTYSSLYYGILLHRIMLHYTSTHICVYIYIHM